MIVSSPPLKNDFFDIDRSLFQIVVLPRAVNKSDCLKIQKLENGSGAEGAPARSADLGSVRKLSGFSNTARN